MTSARLKHIATLEPGGTPRTGEPINWADADGTPWVSIGDMSSGRVVMRTAKMVSPNGIAAARLPIGAPGTVLLAMYATIGATALLGTTATWNQAILGIVPRPGMADARFLRYWLDAIRPEWLALVRSNTQDNLNAEVVGNVRFPSIDVHDQCTIADYLDAEISAMDNLLAKKRRLVALLQERIDSAIMTLVGQSVLVRGDHPLRALPLRRELAKLDRPPDQDALVITAFRDGQVTVRALRRSEGFTESWTEGALVQGVLRGDVVVHGLDGFAGAIGTAEADGVCSPVYHVCGPLDGGDAHFYGRMLRLLATTGYLGNFATSTRERAVDFRNWDLFGSIPLPVVEVAMQRRIGDRIRLLAPIRQRVARSEVLINERKQALITAAVTGQLDFPGVAA